MREACPPEAGIGRLGDDELVRLLPFSLRHSLTYNAVRGCLEAALPVNTADKPTEFIRREGLGGLICPEPAEVAFVQGKHTARHRDYPRAAL